MKNAILPLLLVASSILLPSSSVVFSQTKKVEVLDADDAKEAKLQILWKENHVPKEFRWKEMKSEEIRRRGLFYHDGLNPSPKEKPFATIVATFSVKEGFEDRQYPRLIIGEHFRPTGKPGESKKGPGIVDGALGWDLTDLEKGKDYVKYAFEKPNDPNTIYLIYQRPGIVNFAWYVQTKESQFTLILIGHKPIRFSVK